ncbi:(2Fe-2S)-binding protein [Kitasatospora sp. NPDC002040]|uniref:(2Fe-2S)-binding protein n=1 Tax=Kitasatospora sp. NPDC002040 TaxID=3154661 RepID=UPI00331E77F5
MTDAQQILRRTSALGPFFATVDGPLPPDFRPLGELATPGFWERRINEVGPRLRTDEPRVAASVAQLGLAARLWSVALGTAALAGVVPELGPDRAHWRLPRGGTLELWVPGVRAGEPVAALRQAVAVENLAPIGAAIRAVTPVAERLLWGNAASALAGVLKVLPPTVRAVARPLVGGLLEQPPLVGGGGPAGAFRRTTCCLYYRVPGGGLCGDCVLDRAPGSR